MNLGTGLRTALTILLKNRNYMSHLGAIVPINASDVMNLGIRLRTAPIIPRENKFHTFHWAMTLLHQKCAAVGKNVILMSNTSTNPCREYKCEQCMSFEELEPSASQNPTRVKDCPNNSTQERVPPNVSFGNGSSDKCFKCQQLGHWAKDCPNNYTQEQVLPFSLGNDVIPPKMCRCCRECHIFTSRTPANPGRKFYRCNQCNFFQWCDDVKASASQNPNLYSQSRNRNPSLSPPSNNPNSPRQNPKTSTHEEFGSGQQFASLGCSGRIEWSYKSSILCEIEAGPCQVLTAQTDGSKGQQIFTCLIKKGEGSCGILKWSDKLDSVAPSSNNSVRPELEVSVRINGA